MNFWGRLTAVNTEEGTCTRQGRACGPLQMLRNTTKSEAIASDASITTTDSIVLSQIRETINMSSAPPPPPQWVLDLNSTPASKPKSATLADPPGYTAALTKKERSQASKTQRVPPTPEEMDTLKMKKAWEVAIAPAKQLPMNAFGASRH